jgi:photosystem II stability/assembly factor-like uncharacterized protein
MRNTTILLLSLMVMQLPLVGQVDGKYLEGLSYRFIGPAGMGGRVTDIESVPGKPEIAYVATGGGGLWKTMNGGTTWKPIFERQGTFSIGDIALDPQNPSTIWVGTGETNPRNSVSFGDGVYRSTDAGETWQFMGLGGTERISRILVHPKNSNLVFVGAMGHAFGAHPDRGVFMTSDGGKTWQKTLYVDDQHGVSDLDMDAENPNLLYAGMWRFERKPWTFQSGSEKGGMFRSVDGGLSWKKVEKGLPKLVGRIAVKVAPSRPEVVYVLAEAKDGTLFRSEDHGVSFTKVTDNYDIVYRGFYFTDLRVDPKNEKRLYALAFTVQLSEDGGKSWRDIAKNVHADMHAMWIDPVNPERLWLGGDGGVCSSKDGGEKWSYHNNIPLGQYYQIHADMREPFYHLVGGQQDNSTWSGPSQTKDAAGILNSDWKFVSGGDGFYALSDPLQPDVFLSESQGGRISRTDLRTGESKALAPSPRAGLQTDSRYRFNWNTPIVASPHGKSTYYFAGNVIFQTSNFGKTWEPISGDLSTNNKTKYVPAGGAIFQEETTAENNGTVISLSESPVKAGVIWAGTDDGNVQVTVNGGGAWKNVAAQLGVSGEKVISHVEASRYAAETAFVSVDRHMFDDFKPYLFKTTDGGQTFTSIAGNLPEKAYVQVVKEDPKNPRLLYAGTELGLFVSFEGGMKWQRLELKNMPRVAVHDLLVHPRDNDLVVATHGRGIAILDDIAWLQQMDAQTLTQRAFLFPPRAGLRYTRRNAGNGLGDAEFAGPNPPAGVLLTYWLKEKPGKDQPLRLQIFDAANRKIGEVKNPPAEAGVQRAAWNLRWEAPKARKDVGGEAAETGPGANLGSIVALPGKYEAKLTFGEQIVSTQGFEVKMDPTVPVTAEELREQFQQSLRLRTMLAGTNQALRNLDQVKSQLEASEKLADAAGKARIAVMKKELDVEILRFDSGVIRLRSVEKPRVLQEISALWQPVTAGNGAPTAVQVQAVNEVEGLYRQALEAHNQFVTAKLPGWDEELRRMKLLGLSAVGGVQ